MPHATTLKSRSAAKSEQPQGAAALFLEEARQAGLLDGEKSEHISFRAPKALVEAAMREAGVTSMTALGILGLAMLAQQTDPAAKFMLENYGALGPDHTLDF